MTEGGRGFWLKDEPPDLAKRDAFAVRQLVDRLLPLLDVSPYPFTIALSGSWGAGKTTVASELAREVRKGDRAVCEIDLWTEDIPNLRRTVVIEAAVALRSAKDIDAERRKVAADLDRATRSTRSTPLPTVVSFSWRRTAAVLWRHKVNTVLAVALVAALGTGIWYAESHEPDLVAPLASLTTALFAFLALKSGLFISLTSTTETMPPASVEVELHRKFVELVSAKDATDSPVLVVLDNLDRLPADDALEALRQVRSLVDIPKSRCVFLIPVDRTAFVRQLGTRLGQAADARDYLDKFFSLDIPLTQPEPADLRGWALGLLDDVFGDQKLDAQALADTAAVLASGAQGSPRFIKRVINGVSTRLRMLDPSVRERVTLPQVAFVEVLITRFPQLVEVLASNPRQFTEMRESLPSADDRGAAQQAVANFVSSLDGDKRPEQAAFGDVLFANSGVPLAFDALRQILSLREERFWKGVPEPQRVEEILDSGDDSALREYLSRQDPIIAATVRSRISEHIVRLNADRFYRSAVTAFNAATAELATDPFAQERARQAVLQSLLELGANEGAAQLTPAAIEAVFSSPSQRIPTIWDKVLRQISPESPLTPQLVRVIRAGAAHVPVASRAGSLPILAAVTSDEALSALFDAPVEPTLLQGPVAGRYAERLVAWDSTVAAAQDPALVGARRLRASEDAGWRDAAVLDQIATTAAAQVPRANPFPEPALAVLDGLMEVLRDHRTAAVNALGTTLAAWAGTPKQRVLAAALQLPLDAAAVSQVKSATETWLAGADEPSARALLTLSRARMVNASVDFRSPLLTRWVAGQPTTLCDLAIEDGGESATAAFLRSIASITDEALVARLMAVFDIVMSRLGKDGVSATERAVAPRLAKIPIAGLVGLETFLERVWSADADLSATVEQLRLRIALATRDELERFVAISSSLIALQPAQAPILTRAVADRAVQHGGATPVVLGWLFRREELAGDVPALAGLLEHEIRNPANGAAALLSLVEPLRSKLAGDPKIRLALVQAAVGAPKCEDTDELLTEAANWRQVEGSAQRDELYALLDRIPTKCPEIVKPLSALRE